MSRALEFIQRLFCSIRLEPTSICAIRVSNDKKLGGSSATNVIVSFSNGRFDEKVYRALLHSSHYLEDQCIVKPLNGATFLCEDTAFLRDSIADVLTESIEFVFSHERKPLLAVTVVKSLQTHTILGMPSCIVSSFGAVNIKIYFGANATEQKILRDGNGGLRNLNGCGCTIEESNSFSVEMHWLADNGRLESKKIDIRHYISEKLKNELVRYSFEPRSGLKVYGLFEVAELQEDVPLSSWQSLRDFAEKLVLGRLNQHLSSQVARIERRISEVRVRKRVAYQHIDLGCEPANEVETVLLFQRMSSLTRKPFPNGMEIKILDYSPKDIDSICEYKESSNHPLKTAPVEFEFNLRNFFLHGHDYRQIALVICYTASGLGSPFSYGGVSYLIDRSYAPPRVVTTEGAICFSCLILQDYLELL
jgi:hypothetical protein